MPASHESQLHIKKVAVSMVLAVQLHGFSDSRFQGEVSKLAVSGLVKAVVKHGFELPKSKLDTDTCELKIKTGRFKERG